jgi:hypothetical protein
MQGPKPHQVAKPFLEVASFMPWLHQPNNSADWIGKTIDLGNSQRDIEGCPEAGVVARGGAVGWGTVLEDGR